MVYLRHQHGAPALYLLELPGPIGHFGTLKYCMINSVVKVVVGDGLLDPAWRIPNDDIGVETWSDGTFPIL